jgi:hypothetical protein
MQVLKKENRLPHFIHKLYTTPLLSRKEVADVKQKLIFFGQYKEKTPFVFRRVILLAHLKLVYAKIRSNSYYAVLATLCARSDYQQN